jgi:hypothetical protein
MQPDQQTDRTQFAQSFSKGLKLEFPRFDGDNHVGWLRQAEKCFTLAATPLDQRVHLAVLGSILTACLSQNWPP